MENNSTHRTKPLVSIIIINYNTPDDICDLLQSIRESKYPEMEIIVVDNASKKKGPDVIEANYPEVKVIRSSINLGFAGGNNLGIAESTGDFLFFVNSDTVLTPGTISTLIATFDEYEKIGIVSPKFHLYNEPGKFDYAGCSKINSYTGRGTIIGQNQIDEGQYNTPSETHYCHGGGMMIPRKIIQKVGLIPDQYFLYYEEMEWCELIRKAGYIVFYQPNALILHKVSTAIGLFSTLKTYYLTRNRILFIRRNRPFYKRLIFFFYFCFISFPKNMLYFFVKGRLDHIKYFLLAILWNVGYKVEPKFNSL